MTKEEIKDLFMQGIDCSQVVTTEFAEKMQLTEELKQDLRNCYVSCLEAAADQGLRSIAFCCISTGEFHFPNDKGAEIAVDTVTKFMKQRETVFDRIVFNVFKDGDRELYEKLLS